MIANFHSPMGRTNLKKREKINSGNFFFTTVNITVTVQWNLLVVITDNVIIWLILSRFILVNVISLHLSQSDNIERLPLYFINIPFRMALQLQDGGLKIAKEQPPQN